MNALSPTRDLFGATGMPMSRLTSFDVGYRFSSCMRVFTPYSDFSTTATSSSAVFPARSPTPLMVTCACAAPALEGGDRVRRRQAEVVMAVDADGRFYLFSDTPENVIGHIRPEHAHRIAETEPVRAGFNARVIDTDQIIQVRTRGVLAGQFHDQAMLFGILDHLNGHVPDSLAILLQLFLNVKIGDRDDEVHGVYVAFEGIVYVAFHASCKTAYLGSQPLFDDRFDARALAFRSDGRSCLDDVDAQQV